MMQQPTIVKIVRSERGSVGLVDIAVAMMITGILTVVLMGVISSAYSTTSMITDRADFMEQNTKIGDRLRAALSGASRQGICIDRITPISPKTVSNCRHLGENTNNAVIVSGTSKKVCVLAGLLKGLDTVTGSPTAPVLLVAQDEICIELDSDGVLKKTGRAAGSTEYASATWTGNNKQDEFITALADDSAFSYYDADGTALTISTSLTSDQIKLVRRIKFTTTLTAQNERANEKVSYEFAVGAGRFVSEQKWDGK
jgi:hypothetical protein